ncbi:MAG: GGDEF domain-containing protein [Gammaproteobacteria bacterium]|nr:GGDEF domain-containing protein [Gammaproteobacteria bacterium]
MEIRRIVGRLARRVPARGIAAVLATLLTLAAGQVRADCVGSADPELRALQAASAADAARTVADVNARLAALGAAATPDPQRIAGLDAVLAQSYSRLELDAEARAAARRGLLLAPNPTDPVHVDLLSAYSENVYDAPRIEAQLAAVKGARARQAAGSLNEACLRITEGILEFRLDRADRAIIPLTRAYRSAAAPRGSEARMLAADALTAVMRGLGDYREALTLNDEVIAWDRAHRATLALSVSKYVRGTILKLMRQYGAAIAAFEESRALSVPLHDVQGIAFEDLRICETRVALRDYAHARMDCRRALPVFEKVRSTDVVKETRAVLARIELGEGHPDRALAALDGVLDHHGQDLPPRRVAVLYRWRAQANAALQDYRGAYADLSEYVRRAVADYDEDRLRESEAMRARFATDREIARNQDLKRALALSMERSRRQALELKRNAIVLVSGLLVILLLVYIALASARHRRALLALAALDELTGLPNRRRTTELASQSLREAFEQARPLTIAVLDLDHFKAINDRCGHAAGDHVLRELGRVAGRVLRPGDVLGRWGGEEFLLVMADTTLDAALGVLEGLRAQLLAIQLPPAGAGLRVSLSAGLATLEENARTLDELVARADEALYEAKSQGRDLVRIAERSFQTASTGVRRALRL